MHSSHRISAVICLIVVVVALSSGSAAADEVPRPTRLRGGPPLLAPSLDGCRVCKIGLNASMDMVAEAAQTATRDMLAALGKDGITPAVTGVQVSYDSTPAGAACEPTVDAVALMTGLAHVWQAAFDFVTAHGADSASLFAKEELYIVASRIRPVYAAFNSGSERTGGFGAGFGFSILCGDTTVATWGAGFGGGSNSLPGQHSAGWGGGAGGQYTSERGVTSDFGGGCGCGATQQGVPTGCGSAADQDSTTLVHWLRQAQKALENPLCDQHTPTLCGGGGGGGGFVSESRCRDGFGGGFGFTFAPQSLRPLERAGSCAAAADGSSQHSKAGTASRVCAERCQSRKSQFEACFCPCLKTTLEGEREPWAKYITCGDDSDA